MYMYYSAIIIEIFSFLTLEEFVLDSNYLIFGFKNKLKIEQIKIERRNICFFQ